MDIDALLNQNEAAELLGVAPATLNFWRASGRGPAFVRISKRCVRYRCEDLQKWVDSQRVLGAEARRN